MQTNQTTQQSPAPSRQPIFDPEVIIRRADVGNIVAVQITRGDSRLAKVVPQGGEVKGSARVHYWTPHTKLARQVTLTTLLTLLAYFSKEETAVRVALKQRKAPRRPSENNPEQS
jgi:hypothetical protein